MPAPAFRFRTFPVYQDAKKWRRHCKELLKKFPKSERYLLDDQIERALLSVILNIAEGCSKISDKDFARFLDSAMGSVNEVVAGFDVAQDDGIITMEEYLAVEQSSEKLVNQLGGFARFLRSSKAKKH